MSLRGARGLRDVRCGDCRVVSRRDKGKGRAGLGRTYVSDGKAMIIGRGI